MAERPRLCPPLLPDSDEPFADTRYGREELAKKEYAELRQIAAAHESDEVNGRMPRKELVEILTGMERVE